MRRSQAPGHPRTVLQSLCIAMCLAMGLPLWAQEQLSPGDSDNTRLRSWRLALGAAIAGPPIAQTGSLAAICDDRSIRMVGEERRLLWTWRSREALRPWLSRAPNGMLYAAGERGSLFALNRAGSLVWRVNLARKLSLPVAQGFDGRLFVPAGNEILALNPAGRPLWRQELSASPQAFRSHPGSGGVLAAVGSRLYHLDPFGARFDIELPHYINAVAGIDRPLDEALGTEHWQTVAALDDGSLVRVSNEGYQPLANLNSGQKLLAAEIYEETVYVLSSSGLLQAVSLNDGTIRWQESTAIHGEARLLADERGIYVLGRNAASGFTHDQRRLWTLSLSDASTIAAFSDDGYVYSGGRDWVLYAYRAEDRIKNTDNPLYKSESGKSYGLAAVQELDEVDRFLLEHDKGVELILDDAKKALAPPGPGLAEPSIAKSLLAVALFGTTRSAYARPAPAILPQHRIQALELLSRFASVEQLDALIHIFTADSDPDVRASAADCIASLGRDPGGKALAAFERAAILALDRNNVILMMSVARATGAICRYSGPPLSERGIRLLSVLGAADRPPAIRRAAEKEIALFRRPSP